MDVLGNSSGVKLVLGAGEEISGGGEGSVVLGGGISVVPGGGGSVVLGGGASVVLGGGGSVVLGGGSGDWVGGGASVVLGGGSGVSGAGLDCGGGAEPVPCRPTRALRLASLPVAPAMESRTIARHAQYFIVN